MLSPLAAKSLILCAGLCAGLVASAFISPSNPEPVQDSRVSQSTTMLSMMADPFEYLVLATDEAGDTYAVAIYGSHLQARRAAERFRVQFDGFRFGVDVILPHPTESEMAAILEIHPARPLLRSRIPH